MRALSLLIKRWIAKGISTIIWMFIPDYLIWK